MALLISDIHPPSYRCDFPENVSCGTRPICDANDENCAPQPTAAPTACDDVECPSGGDTWVPEAPCAECVCQCSGGVAREICCQPGLVWNPAVNVCDFPANVPAC